jgi:hypothetical protein
MEWQPIETAPKDGTRILGWSSDARRVLPIRWQGPPKTPADWPSGWRDDTLFLYSKDVTHWMPLPPAPSSTQQGEGK